ncbi:MAG: DUF5615 family PIN-like protein [Anaerolineae bacterium]|nr:DUF5615 family PIN-like protein [Anaerolineae bacterium]
MQFLFDESCDAIMVRALRASGYDAKFVAEYMAGASDERVLQAAFDENRILVTQDRDFCALVFRDGKPSAGVVLVRISDELRERKAQRITELVTGFENRLSGAMTTLTLTDVRIHPLKE